MGGNKEYSEETARDIDIEVKRIIDDTYTQAKEILDNKKPMLIKLAKILMEKEVIEGDELITFLENEEKGKTGETNVN
jgi:ATP-dependent Zn protease